MESLAIVGSLFMASALAATQPAERDLHNFDNWASYGGNQIKTTTVR
jgi:hypothetical protein